MHDSYLSSITFTEWKSILKLSTMWSMTAIRRLAIEHLSKHFPTNAVEIVALGKEYDIPSWLKDGYIHLVKRAEPLSVTEAERIGWQAAIQIYQIRETALVKHAGNRGYVKYTGTLSNNDILREVELVFAQEFAAAEAASRRHDQQTAVSDSLSAIAVTHS